MRYLHSARMVVC